MNEYTLMAEHCRFERPGTYFASSPHPASGGVWVPPSAPAAPDKFVIATLGDGAYFRQSGRRVPCGPSERLPILTIVFNRSACGTRCGGRPDGFIPSGLAAKSNSRVLSQLNDLPAR
ncbi:MAG: hypothetical protein U1E60_09540 [Reyranellaceae bacterium]